MFNILEILTVNCVQEGIFSNSFIIKTKFTDTLLTNLEYIYCSPVDVDGVFFRIYRDTLKFYVRDSTGVGICEDTFSISCWYADRDKIIEFCFHSVKGYLIPKSPQNVND